MRHAIICGIKHGEKLPVVISDATTPVQDQKLKFKEFLRQGQHAEFREVQLWTSDGGIIAHRNLKDAVKIEAEAKAKAEAEAAAEKAAQEAAAAKAKADAEAAAKAKGKK